MDYLVYLCYRLCTALVSALPLALVYRLGQFAGWLAYLILGPYRRLARANLEIAYGGELAPAEVRRLARRHFVRLGANLLSAVKASSIDLEQLRKIAEVEGMPIIEEALARGRGVVMVISHIGNWELFAQLNQFLPAYRFATVYQPLRNRFIEAHVQRARTRHGVVLFSRKSGFSGPTAFLRAGGAVGVLVDQHAGDGGVWSPFFGRLASTSNLAALLALRTGAALVPLAVQTIGPARWRVVISSPVPAAASADGPPLTAAYLTADINQVLESQIARSPADWFWVHNRWKTPRPKFLLATYRRGGALPAGFAEDRLKPFRILIRSTNWLGDAVLTIPAVQAIAQGRPDAQVTVLTPAKLAGLWEQVPGVAAVLVIPPNAGVWTVARLIRSAGNFDVAIVLPNSLRTALEVWLAGVARRVGYAGHRRRHLLNQIVREPAGPARLQRKPPHQSRRYAHLAIEIGADPALLPKTPPALKSAAARLERGAWTRIGICPGAEYGPAKRWPAERFAETAQRVGREMACEWVLFGVEADRELGASIEKTLGGQCENLIGQTSLAELISQLRRCDLLLTNDTGTMHLAAWLGVPLAAVFGSTDPDLTGPWAPATQVRILRHQVVCSPCFLPECPLDFRCMQAVRPEEAAATLLELAGHVPAADRG
jgi:heptosyltransferase-2